MRLLHSLLISSALLLAGCGDKKDEAKPSGPVPVTVKLETVSAAGAPAAAYVRETSVFNPGAGKLLWSQDMNPGTYSLGSLDRGKKVVLIASYVSIDRGSYPRPAPGDYVKAELFADGKSLGSVRADLSDFNNQANVWQEPGGYKHLMKETEITIQ